MTLAQQKRVAEYLKYSKADAEAKAPNNNYRESFIWGYMEAAIDNVIEALEGKPNVVLIYKKGEI